VDDEPMVCAHLRTILGSAGTIEVVDEAHDGAAGVEAVMRSRPDVVLMDLRMPGVDGLTAIERITQLADPPVVVVLTTFDADQYVLRALRAGAAGFLVKSTPPEDLIGLVQVAAEGHTVLSPAAARRLERPDRGAPLPVGGHDQGLRVANAGQAGMLQSHPGRTPGP
jgi:DNA-binding NarL/FixJ family response regulator